MYFYHQRRKERGQSLPDKNWIVHVTKYILYIGLNLLSRLEKKEAKLRQISMEIKSDKNAINYLPKINSTIFDK